jgi:hypothetical protein
MITAIIDGAQMLVLMCLLPRMFIVQGVPKVRPDVRGIIYQVCLGVQKWHRCHIVACAI